MSPLVLNQAKASKGQGALTLCLCMIVKNEEAVIQRCLESVKDYITSWVIVDTGSTDRTPQIIQEVMEGIPGELHHREWTDFATARNQAAGLASGRGCDYILVIDADEILEYQEHMLDKILLAGCPDVCSASIIIGGSNTSRVFLVKSSYPGRWVGAIHEDLEVCGKWALLHGVYIHSFSDGARGQDPNKHNKDLALIFREIEKDPRNPRHYYYLGATYLAAGDNVQAERAFAVRLKFQGNPIERDRAHSGLIIAQRRQHESGSN